MPRLASHTTGAYVQTANISIGWDAIETRLMHHSGYSVLPIERPKTGFFGSKHQWFHRFPSLESPRAPSSLASLPSTSLHKFLRYTVPPVRRARDHHCQTSAFSVVVYMFGVQIIPSRCVNRACTTASVWVFLRHVHLSFIVVLL